MNVIKIKKQVINLDISDELLNISNKIMSYCTNIVNELGNDLSESIYHRALEIELRYNLHNYNSEVIIPIKYKENTVGTVRPDIILDNKYILELKSITSIKKKEINQLKVYLKHTDYKHGFIINFPNLGPTQDIEMILINK